MIVTINCFFFLLSSYYNIVAPFAFRPIERARDAPPIAIVLLHKTEAICQIRFRYTGRPENLRKNRKDRGKMIENRAILATFASKSSACSAKRNKSKTRLRSWDRGNTRGERKEGTTSCRRTDIGSETITFNPKRSIVARFALSPPFAPPGSGARQDSRSRTIILSLASVELCVRVR